MARPSTDAASSTASPAFKVQSQSSVQSAGPVKGAIEYGYPHGHLGHLNPDEEAAFAAFKAHAASPEGGSLYRPGPPASHDDATLLRFLRARRWSVPDAARQFAATEAWRRDVQIDVLYDTIDVAAYEASRRLYPQWLGRRDRRGIPVYLFEIRHLDPKTVGAYERAAARTYSLARPLAKAAENKLVRLFALYENLTRFAQPLCTQLADREHPRTPITLSTNIVDVSGVSLRGYWNLKGHMQAASELATAHYPETLDRIFIIGAPVFFTTVWGWIKRWFDPVTVSKIFILSQSEVLPTLSSFIDPENIPKKYGGGLDFNWCDMPNLDPKIRALAAWENGHTEFPQGPLYWVPADGGRRLACVARGSVDKVQRDETVCTIPAAFADGEEVVAPAPAVNGNGVRPAAAAEEVTSPAAEDFVDAPEQPPAPPGADEVEGMRALSLGDGQNEKTGHEAAQVEGVPNGHALASS